MSDSSADAVQSVEELSGRHSNRLYDETAKDPHIHPLVDSSPDEAAFQLQQRRRDSSEGLPDGVTAAPLTLSPVFGVLPRSRSI